MSARHQKAYRLRQLRGESPFTDAAPIRRHLDGLVGAGWSTRAIAGAASCSPSVVSRVLRGQQTRLTNAVAYRLASIRPGTLPSTPSTRTTEPFVPRVGTVRRLQALMFMGYSHRDLAALGIDSRNLLNQQGRWVTLTRHQQVAEVYDRHALTPGPTPRSGRVARKLGYVGPLAWDDIDIDAEALPDDGPEVTDWDEYDFLTGAGESHDRALERLGITPTAWEKRVERRSA